VQEEADVDGDVILDNYLDLTAGRILAAAAKGPDCWDCDFYLTRNKDLKELGYSCFDAFSHYVNNGQFELRPHRYVSYSILSQCTLR
jgi:hypothetical protein